MRFLYIVKITWFQISDFLPELRYPEALRSLRLWGAETPVGCAARKASSLWAFLAPSSSLLAGRHQWRGSHTSSATTPLSPTPPFRDGPHLLCPFTYFWSLVSQTRERCGKKTWGLFLPFNHDPRMAFFLSRNGCLGNQVLTGSNSYSLFLLH